MSEEEEEKEEEEEEIAPALVNIRIPTPHQLVAEKHQFVAY